MERQPTSEETGFTGNMEWQNMRLSKDFTLWELCRSENHPHLVGLPDPLVIYWLKWGARCMLQPLRDAAQCPLLVTSGYRAPTLNRAVGGELKSIHQIFVEHDFQGVAFDLFARDMPCDALLRLIAAMVHLPIRGIIIYPHENRLHIDSRKGERRFFRCVPPARPGDKKRYPEIPAAEAVNFRLKSK